VDLAAERAAGEAVRRLISRGLVTAVHDISDGGLLVAIAEMALAGTVGAFVQQPPADWYSAARIMFGEDQGRYLITFPQAAMDQVFDLLGQGITAIPIGNTQAPESGLSIFSTVEAGIPLAKLRAAHESFFPKLMGSELTPDF
jgi:phosphoribosylformylglycinamidine synthase